MILSIPLNDAPIAEFEETSGPYFQKNITEMIFIVSVNIYTVSWW